MRGGGLGTSLGVVYSVHSNVCSTVLLLINNCYSADKEELNRFATVLQGRYLFN